MKLQRLLSLTRQALDAYDMIDPGDKIALDFLEEKTAWHYCML